MFDLLRSRLAQGTATVAFPPADDDAGGGLPERFRGPPVIRAGAGGVAELDLGACLFSPEEAPEYRNDYRSLASSTREGLVVRADAGGSQTAAVVAALDARMRGLLGRSLRLRSVSAGSCNGCEAELVATNNVVFDLARFGIQFVASPRHADGLLITGTVNANMREALERTYAAVADPRIVIAVGACAASGGPFQWSESPDVSGTGVPASIPVDLWIAGCPPHPLTILDGLLRLLGRLEDGASRTQTPRDAAASQRG